MNHTKTMTGIKKRVLLKFIEIWIGKQDTSFILKFDKLTTRDITSDEPLT